MPTPVASPHAGATTGTPRSQYTCLPPHTGGSSIDVQRALRHAATALYTALLALLRRQGYVNCFALITHPNPASAAFHERMGFAEAARLPHAGYKDGRWLGLSYYQLTLQPLPAVPVPPVPLSALGAAETERSLRDAAALCRPAPEVL